MDFALLLLTCPSSTIMRSITAAGAVLLSAGSASASFLGNLNYRSPSTVHPGLGLPDRNLVSRAYAESKWKASELNFTHGVASGDPYDDSVILWTRAAPEMDNDNSNTTVSGYVELYSHENDEFVQDSDATVCVDWEIWTTKGKDNKKNVADKGTVYTSSEIDFTVKVSLIIKERLKRMMVLNNWTGRSKEAQALHELQVPVQDLRFGQQVARGPHQDPPQARREGGLLHQAGRILLRQLSYVPPKLNPQTHPLNP